MYCVELPKGDRDGELDDSQTWGISVLESLFAPPPPMPSPLAILSDVEGVSKGKRSSARLPHRKRSMRS